MGAPTGRAGIELTNSFCRTDPEIAAHFARVTFLSDHRADVARLDAPTLILQCSDDLIAPLSVGEFMARTLPRPTLRIIENVGHCPHLSAPGRERRRDRRVPRHSRALSRDARQRRGAAGRRDAVRRTPRAGCC
jgi:pimeloyl-ACP methyl ester carboxylesterase